MSFVLLLANQKGEGLESRFIFIIKKVLSAANDLGKF